RRPRSRVVGTMPEAVVVVPCFNEERRPARGRLPEARPRAGPAAPLRRRRLDRRNGGRVRSLRERADGSVDLLQLATNSGKAEAVRRGMLRALEASPAVVGYVDADLSTPVDEIIRLYRELERRGAAVVMGARVRLLGSAIERREARHYLGRIFATAASAILRIPVYDTQCGAKVFPARSALRKALDPPFPSPRAVALELIGRARTGTPPLAAGEFVEVPLNRWKDVSGSRLTPSAMIKAGMDLLAIRAEVRSRKRASSR